MANTSVDGRHGPIPVRVYAPSAAAAAAQRRAPFVWIHGGGFISGGLDQPESHAIAHAIAATERTVVTVDYRLVAPFNLFRRPKPGPLPGVRFPVPLDDVTDAFNSVLAQSTTGAATLGGASAGACLAAAVALRLRDQGATGPSRLVLAYGTFHAALPTPSSQLASRLRGRHGILRLRPGTVERMNRNYAGTPAAMTNPHAFPGGADAEGLPPTLLLDADRDSLRASGEAFAAELAAAHVPVEHHVIPGTVHGFLNRPNRPHFRAAIDIIVKYLNKNAAG
ncbi:alpha/beta hydrolase [Saccharopolyspora sp. NPDC000995]